MITQRELDIAQIEAKLKAEKLFQEWHSDFLANRGKRGTDENGQQIGNAEGGETAYAEDNAAETQD
jgi:hypothetical protein